MFEIHERARCRRILADLMWVIATAAREGSAIGPGCLSELWDALRYPPPAEHLVSLKQDLASLARRGLIADPDRAVVAAALPPVAREVAASLARVPAERLAPAALRQALLRTVARLHAGLRASAPSIRARSMHLLVAGRWYR